MERTLGWLGVGKTECEDQVTFPGVGFRDGREGSSGAPALGLLTSEAAKAPSVTK